MLLVGITSCYRDTKTCRCAREKQLDFKNECRTVDDAIYPDGDLNYQKQVHSGSERFAPAFNPYNAKEVSFVLISREPHESHPQHLVIANIETGDHRFVAWLDPSTRYSLTDWSKQDIIYVDNKYIYNATTLERIQLPNSVWLSRNVWSPSGDKILGWIERIHDIDLENEWRQSCRDCKMAYITWPEMELHPIDLFAGMDVYSQPIAWSSQNDLYFSDDGILYYTQYPEFNSKKLFESKVKIGGGGRDFVWSPDGESLFCAHSQDGIFRIDKGKNKQYRLKKACPNRQYNYITVSPEGDKIIAERREITAGHDGTYISETHNLVIMDIDGCNEKVLFEDWDGTVKGRL
ncbi:MAG: hypothetical protein KDC92_02000 [Bacteroidetes bacterium]|nr:hypothetical protein [Bacteroidota bacterium]